MWREAGELGRGRAAAAAAARTASGSWRRSPTVGIRQAVAGVLCCVSTHRLGALGQRLQREADVLECLVLAGAAQHVGCRGDGKEAGGRGGRQALARQRQRGGRDRHRHEAVDGDDEQRVAEALALRPKSQRHQPLLDQAVDLRAEQRVGRAGRHRYSRGASRPSSCRRRASAVAPPTAAPAPRRLPPPSHDACPRPAAHQEAGRDGAEEAQKPQRVQPVVAHQRLPHHGARVPCRRARPCRAGRGGVQGQSAAQTLNPRTVRSRGERAAGETLVRVGRRRREGGSGLPRSARLLAGPTHSPTASPPAGSHNPCGRGVSAMAITIRTWLDASALMSPWRRGQYQSGDPPRRRPTLPRRQALAACPSSPAQPG